MKYSKPVLSTYEMPLEVKTMASNVTSCNGGHCVRVRYEGDY